MSATTTRRRARASYTKRKTYNALDIIMASPRPMNDAQRNAYIQGFKTALHAIQFAPVSTKIHWRVMADAVNLVETFCAHPWPDPSGVGLIDIADESGALEAASQAMREAARIHRLQGGSIRLSASGREALADLVDLLDTILQTVSHRSALHCHNECEAAIKQHRAAGASIVTL